jgi:aspartyl-tRNA(Asn)/glutamyl-tRNA(Gln) amidotransferase subunit A
LTNDEATSLTIAGAAEQIRARRLSPLDLTEAYLERIERLNPKLNAYITVTAERARQDARRATEEIAAGTYRGPLHGIPIGLKDLYDTAGIRTTAGSKVHADHVPTHDSTVAAKLQAAGAVLLGKQNTHEYAWGVTTNNPHYGPTRNPWDPSRIPGGSSGGSGAAVAAHLSAGAMGSDTGGSIRIPAALCGVVGLKPTYGRVSLTGVFPMSHLLDHAGPLARSVEDAAILLEAIAGYDAADAASARVPVEPYRAGLDGGVRGLRVGLPRSRFFFGADGEVGAALDAAIDALGRLGAVMQDIELPEFPAHAIDVLVTESRVIHSETLANRPHDLGADLRALFARPPIDGVRFAEGLESMNHYASAVRVALETVDVLLTPTTLLAAAPIGAETVAIGGVQVDVLSAFSANTAPFNVARLPALSVPCGFTAAGLPIGLQIVGRPFDEVTVLRVGYAYERSTDWHLRRPT